MKRYLIIAICILTSLMSFAQRKAQSKPVEINIDRNGLMSIIQYVDGSLKFIDQNGNNTIDANESSYITFKITNTGDGNGYGCMARIEAMGSTQGIQFQDFPISSIKKGETQEIKFPIKSDYTTQNGMAHFSVEIFEPHQMGTGKIKLNVPTHQFEAPDVQVVSEKVLSNRPRLQRKEPFTLQVMVQNLNQGQADDVSLTLKLPQGLMLLSGSARKELQTLAPNEKRTINFELIAAVDAKESLTCELQLKEKHGRYAKDKTVSLNFGESGTIASTVRSTSQDYVTITKGTLYSDIDQNIPVSASNNDNTFALIIANENYLHVASVPYAMNDGKSFNDYCIKTLGIPARNVFYEVDATGNTLKKKIEQLQNIMEAKRGQAKVILYYVGHGMPDSYNGNGNAYLLPTDGYGNDYTTGYKLDDLYAALAKYPSNGVTVLLDACFSGGTRNGTQTIEGNARGIAIRVKQGQPQGNMVVFAAAQGDQTAHPYEDKQHGYFTYFLLKKLQETSGTATLYELYDYVHENVTLESLRNNSKQEPIITPSPAVDANWRYWLLK